MEPAIADKRSLHRFAHMRLLYQVSGWIFVGLGAIGAVLPLLPTTPFILLAAFCFARGSHQAHAWLLENRIFGPVLRDWENGGAISWRTKCVAASMLLTLVGYQILFGDRPLAVRILVGLIASGVLIFIFSRPSRPKHD